MPTSCQDWGDFTGTTNIDPFDEYPEIPNIPPIIDDCNNCDVDNYDGIFGPLRDLFPVNPEVANQWYPVTIFMDHNMRIIHIKHGSISLNVANIYINCMLEAM